MTALPRKCIKIDKTMKYCSSLKQKTYKRKYKALIKPATCLPLSKNQEESMKRYCRTMTFSFGRMGGVSIQGDVMEHENHPVTSYLKGSESNVPHKHSEIEDHLRKATEVPWGEILIKLRKVSVLGYSLPNALLYILQGFF